MELFIISRKLRPDEVELYFKDYAPVAYSYAEKFYSPYLGSAEKEDIASAALQRALETYNPDDKSTAKFTSWLYTLVVNDLKTAHNSARRKGMPVSVRDYGNEEGEETSIFDTLHEVQEHDPAIAQAFLKKLMSKLNSKQQLILNMMLVPDNFINYVDRYNKKHPRQKVKLPEGPLTKIPWRVLTDAVGLSVAGVSIQIQKIRELANQVLQELHYEAKKKVDNTKTG